MTFPSVAFCGLLLIPGAAWANEVPDSALSVGPPAIHVILKSGHVLEARRVRTGALGLATVTSLAGRDTVFSTNDIRTITDEQGRDRTHEVLVEGYTVSVGGPGPPKKEPPAREKGPFLSARVGSALPLGGTRTLAEEGLAADASIHWRVNRALAYGARLDYSGFRADRELETGLASNVDRIRFRTWGGSVVSRYLLAPDHRVDPFLYFTLGAGGFTTMFQGPGGSASHTVFLWGGDYGVGAEVRAGSRVHLDLLATYTSSNTSRSTTSLDGAILTTKGTLHFLQIKAGLIRRLGR